MIERTQEIRIIIRFSGTIDGIELQSGRQVEACRVFEGQRAEEALEQIPALFSICGRAQGVAARLAVERALEISSGGEAEALDTQIVALELIWIHLWRLMVDLPGVLGEEPLLSRLVPLHQLLQQAWRELGQRWPQLGRPEAFGAACGKAVGELRRVVERDLLGRPLRKWQPAIDEPGDDRCWGVRALRRLIDQGTELWNGAHPTMPARIERSFVAKIAAMLEREPTFAARPHYRGVALETGAIARQTGELWQRGTRPAISGVVLRMLARLLEIAKTLRHLAEGAALPGRMVGAFGGSGVGVGWVETARGLLIHRVEVAGGRLKRYQIVAPTEWNFHDEGALARALRRLPSGPAATVQRQATLLVLAADPCVDHRVELR